MSQPNPTITHADTLTFWICTAVSVPFLVLSILATIYIWKRTEHHWERKIFVLFIIQNVFTFLTGFADYVQFTSYVYSKTTLVCLLCATAPAFWFLTTIIVYWDFGFKYWVISKMVNDILSTVDAFKPASTYRIIDRTAVVAFVVLNSVFFVQKWILVR
jgi:hypothetical protein